MTKTVGGGKWKIQIVSGSHGVVTNTADARQKPFIFSRGSVQYIGSVEHRVPGAVTREIKKFIQEVVFS